jgi:hypothetical protein
MIKRFSEDLKKGWWYAVKECFFHLHSGRKTYIICIASIALNYWLHTKNVSCATWIFALSSEYLIIKMCEKHAYESEGMY